MASIITYIQPHLADTTTSIAQELYLILSKYDDRFSYVSGSDTITVDNKFCLVVYSVGWSGFYQYTVQLDLYDINDLSTSLYRFEYFVNNDNRDIYNVRLIRTANFSYFDFVPQSSPSSYGATIFWGEFNNKNYFGLYGTTSYTNRPLESMTIVCIEDQDTTFRIRKIANYKLNDRDLFFTPITIMSSSDGNFAQISDFNSCSNVTYRTVITTNNKNYLAIGTNTLLELDD